MNEQKTNSLLRLAMMSVTIGMTMSYVQANPNAADSSYQTVADTINVHEYVDLGLSVMWATCNVGASTPTEYGDYFMWGDTTASALCSQESCPSWEQSWENITGDSIRDAARAKWGKPWRMPMADELKELLNKCTIDTTTVDGVSGIRATGPNGNSIFLPAAGVRVGAAPYFAGERGGYWSANPHETKFAIGIEFKGGTLNANAYNRYLGRPVRAVASYRTITIPAAEVLPEFPGGKEALEEYVSHNAKYPDRAAKNGIRGRVTISFFVETDGSISGIDVMRTPAVELAVEAVRLIETMPQWTPGRKKDGEPVRVRCSLTIIFRLNGTRLPSVQLNLENMQNAFPSLAKKVLLLTDGKPTVSDGEAVLTVCEVQPEFPGGEAALMKYILDNLKYPPHAAEHGIQGRVTVSYVIETDGSITNIEVMRTPSEELGKEAVRVIESMPKWSPGRQDGKAVRVKYILPVMFRLQ